MKMKKIGIIGRVADVTELLDGQTVKTKILCEELKKIFPDREVIVIDCRPLLSGHGGLHCVTMQFPEGWLE